MKKSLFTLFAALYCAALAAANIHDVHLFPVDFQRGLFSVTENYPYKIVVKFTADVWPLHKDPPQFVIELPAQVKLLQATTRVRVPVESIDFTTENFNRDGKEYTRYTMTLPTRKLNYHPTAMAYWRNGFSIYLDAAKGSAGLSGDVNYYFIHKGEKLLERSFCLTVMPEIPMDRPAFQRFRMTVKEFPSARLADTTILARQLAMWTSFAPKLYMSWSWEHYNYPATSLAMLHQNAEFFFWTFACGHSTMILGNSGTDDLGFCVNNKVTRPGVPPFYRADGTIDPQGICPQYLMQDPDGLFYGEYLRRAIAKARAASPGMKTFIIDYEPLAGGGTCDNCLRDFARFAKLSTVPSREDIQPGRPLNRSWQLYKVHQNKIIMTKIAQAVKRHYPDMEVSFCSTELRPSAEAVNTWDAVDVAAVERVTDFYSFMIYSTGMDYYRHLSYAAEHLTTAGSFPWIDPSEQDERFFLRYSPEKVQQNIIATIALGARGLMFYPTDNLDGRYMTAIARVAGILASLEDVYYGNDLSKQVRFKVLNTNRLNLFDERGNLTVAEYPDLNNQVKIHLHEKDGTYVLSILNYAAEKAVIEVAIPGYNGNATIASDLFNRRNYTGLTAESFRNGFVIEIAAGGSAVIKIGGTPENFTAVTQESLRAALDQLLRDNAQNASIYSITQHGNAVAQWRIFNRKVMFCLIHGENYVTIDPGVNGSVAEWMIGRGITVGRPAGRLSEVIFYDPAQPEVREYSIVRVDLAGELPTVVLRCELKTDTDAGGSGNLLAGLVMEKHISLTIDGELIITDKFINPTDHDLTVAFRIKHTPYSVWRAGNPPVVTAGNQTFLPGVYLKNGVSLDWYAARGAKELTADPVVSIDTGRSVYTLDYTGACGLYFWKNQVLHTAEALYAPVTVKPGETYSVTSKFNHRFK